MDLIVLITGFAQVVLSLLVGVLFIYLAYRIFMKLTRNIDEMVEIKQNNVSVGILLGAVILAVSMQMVTAVETSIEVLNTTLRSTDVGAWHYIKNALIMLGHIVISGLVSLFGVYFAMQIFMWMTKDLDEMAEIKKNNIAVAIVIGVIIIAFALLLRPGIQNILDGLIPFPQRGVVL